MKDKLTAAERVAIEAWATWYLQALTRHLKDVAAVKGRGAVDVPNPLTFAALLRFSRILEWSRPNSSAGWSRGGAASVPPAA